MDRLVRQSHARHHDWFVKFLFFLGKEKYFMKNVFSRDMIQDNWHQCALYQFSYHYQRHGLIPGLLCECVPRAHLGVEEVGKELPL